MLKCIFLAAAVPVLLNAQIPHGNAWWEGKLAKDLNLTEVQQKQITAIRRDSALKLFDLREAVVKAEGELKITFDDSPVDQNKSNIAIEHLTAARSELFRATSQMDLKIRTVLTDDQWQELKKRERRGGPGGPGRPGGPDGGSWRRGGPPNKTTAPTGQQPQNP
jgi:Spy/CpxP family protein refolding chaperone